MRIQKSHMKKGWYGVFDKDEFGHPEESISMPKEIWIKFAKQILTKFNKKEIKFTNKELQDLSDGLFTLLTNAKPTLRFQKNLYKLQDKIDKHLVGETK